jgi:hypothetical protein
MKNLNPSIKYNLLVGLLISLWVFIFAFIIRPFDDGTVNFQSWVLMSVGFSLITFLCYGLLTLIQKQVYQKTSKWNISFEIASLIFFNLLNLICGYVYYKSPILNGGYTFFEFFFIISIKITFVLTPIIILARRYLIKIIPIKEAVLTIKGENKMDVLKIKKDDLVCISNSQNYVEIFFIQDGQLETKLIRTSLKKLQSDLDFLVQVHRSHLINPSHFMAWKNQNTLSLTQIEIPISKNYKERILSL